MDLIAISEEEKLLNSSNVKKCFFLLNRFALPQNLELEFQNNRGD